MPALALDQGVKSLMLDIEVVQEMSVSPPLVRGYPEQVALIVLSAVSLLTALGLWWRAGRREAAVGRVELRLLLMVSPLQITQSVLTCCRCMLSIQPSR